MLLDKRVLIADDSNMIRKILRTNLEKMRVNTILEAADGVSAINMVSSNKLDVVFLDHNMPGFSGLDIVKQMRLKHSLDFVKIAIVSSCVDEKLQSEFEGLGVSAFIKKPFDFEAFESVAVSLLDNERSANQHNVGIDIKEVRELFATEKQNPSVAMEDGNIIFDFSLARISISAQVIARHGSLHKE